MDEPKPRSEVKLKIAVSGAADTGYCAPDALEKTKGLGHEIASRGYILITGATTGAPFWAAIGAKEADGLVVGISPASTEREHVEKYKLPMEFHDLIMYTGFGYSGRNLLMTRTADAVLISCGRIGTLNEFTDVFEDNKPIGVLTGTGGAADEIEEIVKKSHRGPGKIVYDSDPKRLLSRVVELIQKDKAAAV
ncbi:MAG: LOG family protein [Candidatus Sungbacteria bacterium]|uniref:LOG family protein n=1 Tax=Candidatus Sungiibacteriota bacterium TaxID=2750080 RepID=A0A9D6QUA7_9BACT|nr:LOG family protein [Candidatus Sungbacteria bacterium]